MHSERVNVRVLLVWDPEGAGRDELYCKITQHLVQLIAAEQRPCTTMTCMWAC